MCCLLRQVIGHLALLIDTWANYLGDHKEVSNFLDHAEREVKDIEDLLLPDSDEGSLAVGEEGGRMTCLPSVVLKRIVVRLWHAYEVEDCTAVSSPAVYCEHPHYMVIYTYSMYICTCVCTYTVLRDIHSKDGIPVYCMYVPVGCCTSVECCCMLLTAHLHVAVTRGMKWN